MKNKIANIIWKGMLTILAIAGGFWVIVTGIYLLPLIPEQARLIYAFGTAGAAITIFCGIIEFLVPEDDEKGGKR